MVPRVNRGLGLPGGGAAGAGVAADVDGEGVACGAVDPAVRGGDVEVAGATAEAAHVAYLGGGVCEAVELLHGGGSVGACINLIRGRGFTV